MFIQLRILTSLFMSLAPLICFATTIDEELLFQLSLNSIQALKKTRPQEDALVLLGERLFHEKNLSGNRNISCFTCHQQDLATSDQLSLGIGESGAILARRTRHLFNVGAPEQTSLFWDARIRFDPNSNTYTTPEPQLNGASPEQKNIVQELDGALSAQVMFPLVHPMEMRGAPGSNDIADAPSNILAWQLIVKRIVEDPGYTLSLKAAFAKDMALGKELHIGHLAKALAAYIRHTFSVVDTPLDRYLRGDLTALSLREKKGALIFSTKARCIRCHNGPHLSDFDIHPTAVPQISPNYEFEDDLGAFGQNGDRDIKKIYHFRTPPLRNVFLTAPYMHDGVFQNLREVIDHYQNPREVLLHYDGTSVVQTVPYLRIDKDAFRNNLRLAALPPALSNPLNLTEEEVSDLLLFLEVSLTQK